MPFDLLASFLHSSNGATDGIESFASETENVAILSAGESGNPSWENPWIDLGGEG